MNSLVRSTTLHFRPRSERYYEPLDQSRDGDDSWQGTYWKPKSEQRNNMTSSISFRRDRAKKRQIFLKTYKLPSMRSSGNSKSRKMKKVVVKVRSAVVSVLSLVRFNSLTSCRSPSVNRTSSPNSVQKCF